MLGDEARNAPQGSHTGFQWDKDLKAWVASVDAVLFYTTDGNGGTVTADDVDEDYVL